MERPHGLAIRLVAWAVHALTAAGLALAAFATIMIVRGDDASLRAALLALLVATVIDAVDGSLARSARVVDVLPGIDGRTLDDIVDFHTYTSVPLFLLWRIDALPSAWSWLLLAPLLASAYGFSRTHAKTPDGFLLGFPSYWNVVAFYIFFLQPPAWLTIAVILLLTLLTFVPSTYLYPSTGGRINRITTVAGVLWGALMVLIIAGTFVEPRMWTLVSLAFPLWYMGASWVTHLRR